MSARSRSRPWYRDRFDLGEDRADCLRGYGFALRCVPNWQLGGLELLPAARVWFVPGQTPRSLGVTAPDRGYGFPFASLLGRPHGVSSRD
jgi:hypothetical protein